MNPVMFSVCVVCAIVVGLTQGAFGIICYVKHVQAPTTVECKDGSCFVNIYHSTIPMIGAGCGPKHQTGYTLVGHSTFYYCNEDLCNKYWTDAKHLLFLAKETQQLKVESSPELKNGIRDRSKNEIRGNETDAIRGKLEEENRGGRINVTNGKSNIAIKRQPNDDLRDRLLDAIRGKMDYENGQNRE